jgi:integrase
MTERLPDMSASAKAAEADSGQDPLTGKRFRPGRSGFKTKREAEQALRKAIAAHESGRSVKATHQTAAAFLSEWLRAVRPSLRASAWASYRNYLDSYVTPVTGDSRLRDLTPVRLNLLYGHLLEHGRAKRAGGLAPKTVRNVHVMLHRALGDAVRWDLLPRNVAEDATPPRVSRKRPTVWTPDQLGRFAAHVEGDRFFALWLLVVTTGFRRGELAGLLRHDVDLHHGRVTPSAPRVVVDGRAYESETKTRSGERSLALDPTTSEALRDYIVFWDEVQQRALVPACVQLRLTRLGQPVAVHPYRSITELLFILPRC